MDQLEAGLGEHDLRIEDLDACLVTHIHLDHAGAAGLLAARGVPIHVHEFGVRHLVDPSKLLSSRAPAVLMSTQRLVSGRPVRLVLFAARPTSSS